MNKILKEKGFDVFYLENGDLRSMKMITREFLKKLRRGEVGLFYYTRHNIFIMTTKRLLEFYFS